MTEDTRLLLTCKVPAEPSARRIAIWRKAKRMGAVCLPNGVCVLLRTDDHLRRLKTVETDIAEAVLDDHACRVFDARGESDWAMSIRMSPTSPPTCLLPPFPPDPLPADPAPLSNRADRQRQRAALARPDDRMFRVTGMTRADGGPR